MTSTNSSSNTTRCGTDTHSAKNSMKIAESAESLRNNLVIDQKDGDHQHQGHCSDQEVEKITRLDNRTDERTNSAAEIVVLKSGKQTYTKITPIHPSHVSNIPDIHHIQNIRSKRLKEDPHLQHLRINNKPKALLLRSTSMPVTVDDLAGEIPQGEKTGMFLHRKIYRTGSISDYTKQKLKSSILMKTSASLVRKPSITDFEMRQIQTDADSSQSEDEEDEIEGCFIGVTSGKESATDGIAQQHRDESCHRNALQHNPTVSSPGFVVSTLPEASVTLVVAMTSA